MAKSPSKSAVAASPSAQIDFLPERFRQQQAERVSYGWRFVVVLVFCVVIACVSTQQRRTRRSVEAALSMARHQQAASLEAAGRMQALEQELAGRRTRAELLTYLRQPWSHTAVLRSLVGPLPGEIRLTELKVSRSERQPDPAVAGVEAAGPLSPEAGAATEKPPEEQALGILADETLRAELSVMLSGVASDTLALHAYLRDLSKSPWLLPPRIQTVDREAIDRPLVRFVVQVQVRPPFEDRPAAGERPGSEQPPHGEVAAAPSGGAP